jgi:hypothetical protein
MIVRELTNQLQCKSSYFFRIFKNRYLFLKNFKLNILKFTADRHIVTEGPCFLGSIERKENHSVLFEQQEDKSCSFGVSKILEGVF